MWLEEPGIFFSIDADLRVEIRHGQHRETDLGIGEPGGAGALGVILKPPKHSTDNSTDDQTCSDSDQ